MTMKTLTVSSLAVLAVVGFSAAALTTDALAQKRGGKCTMASATGTGLIEQVARQQADQALAEGLQKSGQKAQGKASYKCDGLPLMTTCTVTQKACGGK